MPSLTRREATERARLLSVHEYLIDLDLTGTADGTTFVATTVVRFGCREPGAATFAELVPERVVEARLNDQPVTPTNGRLASTDLRADNELVVSAVMACSRTGEGLHRYVDPEDGQVYLYAQAGPDLAGRIFACFDQPDLKAPIRLTVTAPPQWLVRANAAGAQTAPGRWEFEATAPISTYLMTVVAGPFHAVYDEHDGIPLALLSRRALADTLDRDAADILHHTKVFFDRYDDLFGVRYPFGKYDQVFVPEFNWGAVENPGCVNFREEMLFTSTVTDIERATRTVVIAHEMAHMWFGDLVTLRWWDDIWLNESFAEYMGWRLTAEASRFTNAWTQFAVGRKGGGYQADQRPSTHPVAPTDVPDTDSGRLNFDGISYAKGASVLRQLVAWLGDDAFLAGLRKYFATHAFGNASLDDFLAALAEASGRDVAGWAELWLRRPQVNTLRPEVGAGLTVLQSAPAAYPTLRPHRIGIGSYRDGALVQRIEVDIDGPRTDVPALAPGNLLLLNDTDLTFAKVRFDPASLGNLRHELPRLTDPLARAVAWSAAADSTRDGELSVSDYIALAAAGLAVESEVSVFNDVLDFAQSAAVNRYAQPADRPELQAALHAACRTALTAATPGSSAQLAAARGVVRTATDPALLRGWLADAPAGVTADAEWRWGLVHRLVALGAAGEPEIAAQAQSDPGGRGVEHAVRARAAIASAAAKAAAWSEMLGHGRLTGRQVVATAAGFWQVDQAELTAPYVARFFAEAPAHRLTANIALFVLRHAFPDLAVSAQTLVGAEAMLARDDLDPVLRRVAIDATDDLRRSVAVRAQTV